MVKSCSKVFFVIMGLFAKISLIQAETDVWITLSTAIITGTRISQTLSQLTRNVSVIDEEKIKNSDVNSVPELLEYVLSSDIQTRSPYGIQADVTMRGSTFQQVLVLIDGIRINDSQTAHHNMDLPLTLKDIDRIEVLQGHGSSVYGPDAFGGVVNIVTKKPQSKEFSAHLKIAEYNTYLISGSYGNKWDNYSQKISFTKIKSDGFRYDTDFDNRTVFSNSSWEIAKFKVNLSLGFMDKKFGAYDFYTPKKNYPSKEWTKTYFAKLDTLHKTGKTMFQQKIFFRRHDDKFMLDITRPEWYLNEHITYLYGGEIQATIPLSKNQTCVAGGEIVYDVINSTGYGTFYDEYEIKGARRGLGSERRSRHALFVEYSSLLFGNLNLNAGLRMDNSNWGLQISPNIGVSYMISPEWKLRSSLGHAFRSPSFTELYYKDPANEGNSKLKPEEAISYEAGVNFTSFQRTNMSNFCASVTLFGRDQKNLIDWVGETEKGPWKAENIGEVRIFGIDSEVKFTYYSFDLHFGYSWMGSKKTKEYYSKYALRYPTNQFFIELMRPVKWNINTQVKLIYKERLNELGYFVVNSRISKSIKNLEIFVEGTNLLDQEYEEITDVRQPGRWLAGGVNYHF